MAKSGLDWFRIDVDFEDKFELVCAEYGSVAFEVIVRLWQKIYKEGYYTEWNKEVALLFAKRHSLGGNVVSEIIECCIKREIFDKRMRDEQAILTSAGIQNWYINSTERRQSTELINEYLLVSVPESRTNVNIISKNVNINAENANRSKHSRVENSRVEDIVSKKESKEKNACARESYEQLLTRLNLSEFIKKQMFKFIQWQQANGKVITNSMLETMTKSLLAMAERRVRKSIKGNALEQMRADLTEYRDDIDSFLFESIQQALNGQFFEFREPKNFKTATEWEAEAEQDLAKAKKA